MTDKPKRRYVSGLRQAYAEATRQRIADAARTLMLAKGFAATTMQDVAQAAGVAVPTLYASCPGGKPALAKLVYDVTLAGDAQEVPMSERPAVRAILAEPDPARKLAHFAATVAAIAERIAPVHRVLRAADGGLDELLADAEAQRRSGTRGPAQHLSDVGALRPGLDTDRAADQLYALTSIEIYERLTGTCGWNPAEYANWLAQTLCAALLPMPETRVRAGLKRPRGL